MKYRGIIIEKIKWLAAIDIGKKENSPVKPVFNTGYSPIGVGYPMELKECYACIDGLIERVIRCCGVKEQEAKRLINETN
jgi:hypothetical protein